MGTPLFHANELCGEILRLIEVNLKTSLGLKRVVRGSLKYHAVNDVDLTTNEVPAVYVHPAQAEFDFAAYRRHEGRYMMRIVYVKNYGDGASVTTGRIQDLEDLAELMVNNIILSSLSLSNGQVIFLAVRQVDYEPPEDDIVLQLSQGLTAGAIQLEIETRTTR